MMNGTFKVSLSTPMGPQRGTITFIDETGVLSGSIRFMGSENPFRNGKTSGNTFEFAGTLKTVFNQFNYTARGTVNADQLKATVNTSFGIMQVSGPRVS